MEEQEIEQIKPNKLSVENGDYENQAQKVRFNKAIILGFLAKGVTKKASAAMAGVTEQTFYNYCKDDLDFKQRVDACLGGEDKIQALVNLSQAVKKGDLEASKYVLNKTRHYEKRYDPKWMDDETKEVERNPATGVFEVVTDLEQISGEILGEEFEFDAESGLDHMEQILMAQDEDAEETIKEMLDE